MPHFYGTCLWSENLRRVSSRPSDQTRTHSRRQTRYRHYVRTVRLFSYQVPLPPILNKNRVSKGYRENREALRLLRPGQTERGSCPRDDGGNSGAPKTSQPLIPRNHLQDSLVSFPCFQPRRTFTPQRSLIGCAPWPVYYTGCQNTFSPLVILPAPIQKNLPPLTFPPLSPSCRRHLYPRAAPGQRVCVLVSQSGRPNEMHNGIVATRRVSRSKRRFPWPGGSGAPCKPPQKKTLRQKCLPDVQQHLYSRIG